MTAPVERIRGGKLRALRIRFFRLHPLCAGCETIGRVSLAVELDHIVALANGGTNAWSNYQGLCKQCHEDKTATDLGYTRKHDTGLDGWPIPQQPRGVAKSPQEGGR